MARGFKGFNRRGNDFPPMVADFAYTGGMQTFVVPHKALYKLEVWGAQGGGGGGNGGYSIGYKVLEKGTTLYVCVGGKGGNVTFTIQNPTGWYNVGGYNGGGDVYNNTQHNSEVNSGGGGATHIALVNGTIASIGKTSFVDNGNGLIVAGGGAGYYGGGGGGTNGGDGSKYADASRGTGGTQSSGGYNPYVWDGKTQGSFGRGGNGVTDGCYLSRVSGGGGGLYGGGGGVDHAQGHTGSVGGGGGGSGYTGGVPEVTYRGRTYTPIMYGASSGGNGKARITLVK